MADTADALDPGTPPGFKQWCVVELFGHQRFAGLLTQADWPPGFGRLDIPATPGHEAVTQLVNPSSIYRLTPTTQEIATAVAASCRPEPVHRWELPAVTEFTGDHDADYGDEDDLDDEDELEDVDP